MPESVNACQKAGKQARRENKRGTERGREQANKQGRERVSKQGRERVSKHGSEQASENGCLLLGACLSVLSSFQAKSACLLSQLHVVGHEMLMVVF